MFLSWSIEFIFIVSQEISKNCRGYLRLGSLCPVWIGINRATRALCTWFKWRSRSYLDEDLFTTNWIKEINIWCIFRNTFLTMDFGYVEFNVMISRSFINWCMADNRIFAHRGPEYDDVFGHVLFGIANLYVSPLASQFAALVFASGTLGFYCVIANVTCPYTQ